MPRLPSIHHCTSQPLHFFGRASEVALLDDALAGGAASVVAMVGPGGQGKTAIVQHWLQRGTTSALPDGVFLWSFYRNKDSDLFLRHLLAYADGLASPPEVAASYCVDRLVEVLRRERWALVLDGAEVVQHEAGAWHGRFAHPELARLLEELAVEPMPGVAVVTTRFPLPGLRNRHHARIVSLSALDPISGRELLRSLGVAGSDAELEHAAMSVGLHAKAVELLGTYQVRLLSPKHQQGTAPSLASASGSLQADGASDEEIHVARVLHAFRDALPQEDQDILALATAFRQPPTEARLLEYLRSKPVADVLTRTWGRGYVPFRDRDAGWLEARIQELVDLRLLERVGLGQHDTQSLIDAHPLVRRGFEHVVGKDSGADNARTRAGFLRGRPDRRPPGSLDEAREEVELFHAYCDAGLWNEADGVLVALDNPKHRFLAPAFERDLLLRFFPEQDWRRPPAWPGFGRYRSLAICFEMLGQFEDALIAYRDADAPLRGDALIALGQLGPLLDQPHVPQPWQALWQAYRAHALCLAGRVAEAAALARSLVPVDTYEWVHVFECLLRAGRLDAIDLASLLYRPPFGDENRWSVLARRRMRADYHRATNTAGELDLAREYRELLDAYDRGGLPYERALTRLSYARCLLAAERRDEARAVCGAARDIGRRFRMPLIVADASHIVPDDGVSISLVTFPLRP